MSNRLARASSPYLRMHADNPVDWQPWDDAALAQARDTDTPILLSIGYSACHWCHVMAHECFEDAGIAAAMNRAFVNIKLDREERPDIDQIYQLVHQALTGRGGGWPLTVFLDPQTLTPFYIGTYFPPVSRHGLPAFGDLVQQLHAYFDAHRDDLRSNADTLRDWLHQAMQTDSADMASLQAVSAEARQRIETRFDPDWGGSRGAPKFPRAAELEWLLDQRGDAEARQMAGLTLEKMATRGLQDHIGGGFFRYCVDAAWTIPHFEKMLYDNAQLLPVYARVAVDGEADAGLRATSAAAVDGILAWLARDMTTSDGAFCSALDADSAGGEGGFYLWTREAVHDALPPEDHALADAAFGLDGPPNFEGTQWHLLRTQPLDVVAQQTGTPVADVQVRYDGVRQRLFAAREAREHPARDDKVLTAWNALTISALARVARLREDADSSAMAHRALAALRARAWIDGRLYANVAAPAARIPGFLDDHALLLDALLEMLQLDFDAANLEWAVALADTLCREFADPEHGGFVFSTPEHATPLAQPRSWTDDALPNGSAVAIRALLRLGHLLGRMDWVGTAEQAVRAGAGALRQYPEACPSLLRALAEWEQPRPQLVVRAPHEQRDAWRAAARTALAASGLMPGDGRTDVFLIPSALEDLPGLLSTRTAQGSDGTAWICAGQTCQAPIMSPDALAGAVHETGTSD